jgi:hypothetical protein
VRQHDEQHISFVFGQLVKGEDAICGSILGKKLPSPTGDVGGLLHGLDGQSERGRDDFGFECASIAESGQCFQMRMLDFAESERAGQRIDRGDRRIDRPTLFEPDVPVDSDAREFGNFLAPETDRATPPSVR